MISRESKNYGTMRNDRASTEIISPKLTHLHGFNQTELQEWLEKYQAKYGGDKTLVDLDHLLHEFKKTKWYYQIKIALALSTNIPYFTFQLATFNEGIDGLAEIISPGSRLPKYVSFPIGATISISELLLYLLMFSIKKEAELATLNYALRDPLPKLIRNKFLDLKNHPAIFLKEGIKFSLIQAMMFINNLNGTMTELIDLPPMDFLPAPVRASLMGAILYFGLYYHELYLNKMCLNGVKKWHEEKHLYLFDRLLRGEVSRSFRVFAEGVISTIVVRTWPFNVSVALKAWEVFGLYIPIPIVALAILFHTYYTFYPGTYEQYFNSLEKIEAILDRTITEAELNKKIQENYFVNKLSQKSLEAAKEVERYHIIDEKRQKLIKEYWQTENKVKPFYKQAYQGGPVLYCGLAGGLIGWHIASFLFTPLYIKLPIALLNAVGFLTVFGKAEYNRIIDDEILKQLEQQQLEALSADEKKTDIASTVISTPICVLAAASGFCTNIGTAARLNVIYYAAIPALLNSINGLIFNLKMLPGTVKEYKDSFWNSAMSFWSKPKETNNLIVEEVVDDKKSLLGV